uniref:Uncharacterized protein n=1 Tax=Picea sitchensis TaxID=3332 RepID=A9P0P7_PICSI|nr:unknown [Picea sitchensis]
MGLGTQAWPQESLSLRTGTSLFRSNQWQWQTRDREETAGCEMPSSQGWQHRGLSGCLRALVHRGIRQSRGLCYGKLEAAGLTLVIPTLLLGHLTGLMDDQFKLALLGIWMALFTVFAARKFTQPIKDDIGDKSIFMFNALSEEEKAAFLRKREEQIGQNFIRD